MAPEERSPSDLSSLVRCGVALFAVAALYSGIAQRGEKPVYCVLAVVGASLLALVVEGDRPAPVLRSPLILWAYLFLLVTLGWGLWRTAITAGTDQAIVDRFRSLLFLLALAVAFDDGRARRAGGIAVVIVAVISSGVNVAEALGFVSFPGETLRTPGRAAGLYENPNGSGLAIVFGLAAGLPSLPRALRVPALVACACGVAATFSRGAAASLAALVVVLLWQRELPLWHTAIAAGAAAAAFVVSRTVLASSLEASGALTENNLARLAMTADDSGRRALASRAWQLFLESPWVGHGVAIERGGRVAHNMYLALAVEHGLLGLVAYPAFVLALCLRRRAALGTAAVCAVAAFTSHNLLDSEPALVCCALAAARPAEPGQAPAVTRSSTPTVRATSLSTE